MFKALLTTIALGISSVASASTPADIGWLRHVVEEPAPSMLAYNTKIGSHTTIDANTQREFASLQLTARVGATKIQRVWIQYANGQMQLVQLKGKIVDAKHPTTIRLWGTRAIERVTIVGAASTRGATIDVLGYSQLPSS